jgi:hypothetical protein
MPPLWPGIAVASNDAGMVTVWLPEIPSADEGSVSSVEPGGRQYVVPLSGKYVLAEEVVAAADTEMLPEEDMTTMAPVLLGVPGGSWAALGGSSVTHQIVM